MTGPVTRGPLRAAALLGAFGVALGAFGAHGLRDRLTPAALEIYRTGVLYHLLHAVALLVVALAPGRVRWPRGVAGLFVVGVVLFSGSLYALALTGQRWLGAVTPLGGVAFITGWSTLFVGGWGDERP